MHKNCLKEGFLPKKKGGGEGLETCQHGDWAIFTTWNPLSLWEHEVNNDVAIATAQPPIGGLI